MPGLEGAAGSGARGRCFEARAAREHLSMKMKGKRIRVLKHGPNLASVAVAEKSRYGDNPASDQA